MSGSGGYKHRSQRLDQKRRRKKKLGKENVAKARALFEAKGQTWDPAHNSVHAQALNHDGRRAALGAPRARS
jgi:hypothetical protein